MYSYTVLIFLWLVLVPQAWGTQHDIENTGPADMEERALIPDVFVSFDTEGKTAYAILVEKSTQQLFAYAYDGSYKQIHRFKSSTGEVSGPKALDGDRKTPEGVFLFTERHEKRDLSPIYGNRAYPTDYPNIVDRLRGRTGDAIWMHGTNRPLKDRDSNGCIVLKNRDIDRLAPYISLNRTPIIIVDTVNYIPQESVETVKPEVVSFLSDWRDAFIMGTYHQYLSFYDAEYLPDISWWTEWGKIRKTFLSSHLPLTIEMEKTSIARYNGSFVIWFDQIVRSGEKDLFSGTRKLFLRPAEETFKIIGEEYMVLPQGKIADEEKNPILAVSRDLKKIVEGEYEIPDLIDRWLSAWSSKNTQAYGDFYAKTYRSQGGGDLEAWLRYKRRLNRRYASIRVSITDLVVEREEDQVVATFIQNYTSTGYRSVGKKTLIFIREGGGWKIYRETSEEI